MPVPDQRDPEVTRTQLEGWLRQQLTGASDVRVSGVQTPAFTGFSAETLIFDAEWTEGGQPQRHKLIMQIGAILFHAPHTVQRNLQR